jgi:hypothetical protein
LFQVLGACTPFDSANFRFMLSEHNPTKLGYTVQELAIDRNNDYVYDKMKFSMCTPEFMDHLAKTCKDKKVAMLHFGLHRV